MRFINFTQHQLTAEQIEAAKSLGATEIVEAKTVIADFAKLANDDGMTPAIKQAEAIAQAISGIIIPNDMNIIHFPISSPRVMAAFFRVIGKWDSFILENDECAWDFVYKYVKFVFSHTDRESVDVVQEDGSVKKTTVFKFNGYVEA